MSDEIPLSLEREAGAPDHIAAIAVGFGMVPIESKKESAKAGHPVFVEREFVSIRVPGDKNSHSLRFATDKDRKRFPKAYAAFKERATVPIQGMPIEQWPQITRAQALTLKAMHIHTVESLGEVHDGHIDKLGQNARELRTKAKAFLAQAKDTATAQKIAAENQQLKDQIADLQQQFARFSEEKHREAVTEKRGPGRPPKSDQAAA